MTTVLDKTFDDTNEWLAEPNGNRKSALILAVDLRRFTRTLLAVVTALIIVGTIANSVSHQVLSSPDHKIAKFLNRFDIGYEPSLPNWYSSITLAFSSILLATIGIAKKRMRDRHSLHWIILSLLFLGLSIDEGVRFHEMLHNVIVSRVEVHGIFYFPWVVPAFIFVGLVGLSYIPFLMRLDRPTAIRFVAAGFIYVLGAVGMDMAGGVVVEQYGMSSVYHTVTQLFEELLEMLGIILFLYALLDHIRHYVGPISLQIKSQPVAS